MSDRSTQTQSSWRWWEIVESIAKSISFVLVPFAIAFAGLVVKKQSADRTTSQEYVKLSISILNSPKRETEQAGLRGWAVHLLKAYSPVALPDALTSALEEGDVVLPRQTAYYPPLDGYCTARPMIAPVGAAVTFTAHAIGGDDYYSYTWKGSEELTGNRSVTSKKFQTPGEKIATTTFFSNGQSVTRECRVVITAGGHE